MCRQLGNMSYTEASFVHAMLDSDLSNTITLDEFMQNINKSRESLDVVSRAEHRALEVLQQASSRIAQNLDAFWAAFSQVDIEGQGYIDISRASKFFKVGHPACSL